MRSHALHPKQAYFRTYDVGIHCIVAKSLVVGLEAGGVTCIVVRLIRKIAQITSLIDAKCFNTRLLISHWLRCYNNCCYICAPWIRPTMLDEQRMFYLSSLLTSVLRVILNTRCFIYSIAAKRFLNDIFGIFGERTALRPFTRKVAAKLLRRSLSLNKIGSSCEEEMYTRFPTFRHGGKHKKKRTNMHDDDDFIQLLLGLGIDAEEEMCMEKLDRPGPSGYSGKNNHPMFLGTSFCVKCGLRA
ncbi:hypothetical protein NECAME_07734 [Necator americanus]|uniref:Uncharacterized protein n=1 Tax=Necator americanus TaxID=51031 RepID=W2TL75_NECAM|nr:hypothetical protein NECAME_07734 [Necator americanus]ETN82840.1 hypothetical protein NECAME_07734 [Necator americanus]